MEKIHGLINAPFTPFDEKGEVNLAHWAELRRRSRQPQNQA